MTETWYTVQQPFLFPPIYMMERFARCHHVVVLDDAQFDRDNTQLFLTGHRGPVQKSLPLVKDDYRQGFNKRVVMDPPRWRKDLLRTAQSIYGRSPHFIEWGKEWLEKLTQQMTDLPRLTDFSTRSVEALFELLAISTRLYLGSDLVPKRPENSTAWLASFCEMLPATDYVQGEKSMRSYFVEGPFESTGVRTWGQRFSVEYDAVNGQKGNALCSVLDMLFWRGIDETRYLLRIAHGPGNVGDLVLIER